MNHEKLWNYVRRIEMNLFSFKKSAMSSGWKWGLSSLLEGNDGVIHVWIFAIFTVKKEISYTQVSLEKSCFYTFFDCINYRFIYRFVLVKKEHSSFVSTSLKIPKSITFNQYQNIHLKIQKHVKNHHTLSTFYPTIYLNILLYHSISRNNLKRAGEGQLSKTIFRVINLQIKLSKGGRIQLRLE